MGNKYIFRVDKLPKHLVQSRVQHALREIHCPDADPALKHLNTRLGTATYKEFKDQLKAKLKGIRIFREDSPPVLEVFISASPDFFKKGGNQQKMFEDSHDELIRRFGKENILLATIHRDETSPHLSAFIVPLAVNPEIAEYEAEQSGIAPAKKGRRKKPFSERPPEICLSAKAYIDGPRSLSKMQTEFWEAAGKGVGLERGKEGSKAIHMKVGDWKRGMDRLNTMQVPEFHLPEMTLKDRATPVRWANEVKASLEKQVNAVMKEVSMVMADAKMKQEKIDGLAKRLNTWEEGHREREKNLESLIQERGTKIAEAGLFMVRQERNAMHADLAELEQRRAADAARASMPDPVRTLTAQINGVLSGQTILMRALAKTIKQTYTEDAMARLAHEMGVPPGKGDIFDRMVKSGQAPNFETAVMQVAAHINIEDEGGGRNAIGVASEPQRPA